MEIVYCSRCGGMIPPGGIEEGKYVLVDDEPVCNACAENLPRVELERATPTQVPAAERKRPTTKLMAAARRPSSRRLPETVAEAESGPPRWVYSTACGVGLVLILVVAVTIAMSGGDEELPPPPPAGQPGSGTDVSPEAPEKPDPGEAKPPDPPGEDPPKEKPPEKKPPVSDPKSFYATVEFDGLKLELLEYRGVCQKENHRPVLVPPGGQKVLQAGSPVGTNNSWKFREVPPLLENRARIFGPQLTANRDKPDLYRMRVSGPCTAFAVYTRGYTPRALPWMDENWRPTGLTCASQSHRYEVRVREMPAGEFLLGGGTRGSMTVNFAFAPAGLTVPPPEKEPERITEFLARLPDGTLRLSPEEDASYETKGTRFWGSSNSIKVCGAGSINGLLKFDLSDLPPNIESAKLCLYLISTAKKFRGTEVGLGSASHSDWTRKGFGGSGKPDRGEAFASWKVGTEHCVEFDVTEQVRTARGAGRTLSLTLFAKNPVEGSDLQVSFRTRDHADPERQPAILVKPAGEGAEGPRERQVAPAPDDAPETGSAPVAGERSLPAEADASFPLGKKYARGTTKHMSVGPKGKSVGILRFDLSETRAPVGRAVLKLNYRYNYQQGYAGAEIGLAAVGTQDWGEESVNGKTPLRTGPVCVRWTAAADSPPHFDVTAIVNEALAAGQKKVSFLLVMEKDWADKKSIALGARECGNEAKTPKLVITPGK
jgi:hypothetical protein